MRRPDRGLQEKTVSQASAGEVTSIARDRTMAEIVRRIINQFDGLLKNVMSDVYR
jgi:hypothetical protein